MSKVKLPVMDVTANGIDPELTEEPDLQQISPSSLLAHLGVRSLGQHVYGYGPDTPNVRAIFNAETMLAYYDIGKNYYFNRQEKFGVVIDYSESVVSKRVYIRGKEANSEKKFNTRIEPPAPNETTGEPDRQLIPLMFQPQNIQWCNWTVEGINLSMGNDTKVKIKYIPRGGDISNEITITLTNKPIVAENQVSPSEQVQYSFLTENDYDTNGNIKPEVLSEIQAEREAIKTRRQLCESY